MILVGSRKTGTCEQHSVLPTVIVCSYMFQTCKTSETFEPGENSESSENREPSNTSEFSETSVPLNSSEQRDRCAKFTLQIVILY